MYVKELYETIADNIEIFSIVIVTAAIAAIPLLVLAIIEINMFVKAKVTFACKVILFHYVIIGTHFEFDLLYIVSRRQLLHLL